MVQKIKFLSTGFSVTQSCLAQWMDGLASSLTAQPTGWVVVSLAVCVGFGMSEFPLFLLQFASHLSKSKIKSALVCPSSLPHNYLHSYCKEAENQMLLYNPITSCALHPLGFPAGQHEGTLFISIHLHPPNAFSSNSTSLKK